MLKILGGGALFGVWQKWVGRTDIAKRVSGIIGIVDECYDSAGATGAVVTIGSVWETTNTDGMYSFSVSASREPTSAEAALLSHHQSSQALVDGSGNAEVGIGSQFLKQCCNFWPLLIVE